MSPELNDRSWLKVPINFNINVPYRNVGFSPESGHVQNVRARGLMSAFGRKQTSVNR